MIKLFNWLKTKFLLKSEKGKGKPKNIKDTKINYSKDYKKYLRKQRIYKTSVIAIQITILVSIFLIWELLTRFQLINSFLFSSPSKIYKTLIDNNFLVNDLLVTLSETIISFAVATGLGALIAIILWWSKFTRKVLEPYIIVLNSLPKIALGPIIILAVGIGTEAIIVMAILIMIFITIISLQHAFLTIDQSKVFLLKSMRASKFQILTKLVLPGSLPSFISVLKINVGLSWVGVIMGEYLVSRAGLGYLIIYGGQTFKLDLIMTSTVILCFLASIMYFIVALIEKKINNSYKR